MKIITKFLLLTMLTVIVSCAKVETNNEASGDGQSAADELANERISKENAPPTSENPAISANENSAKSAENVNQNSPNELVEELYKTHETESNPFFQFQNRALVDRFFAKKLGDMIWKDAVESKGEAGALEFDPLYNAQDTEISDFAVGTSEINGEKATVPVTFKNFGEEQTIKYLLEKENNNWKIADIDYGEFTLTKVFNKNSK